MNISLLAAPTITAAGSRRDLIVGQLGASATSGDGELVQNVQTMTSSQIATKFGANVDLRYRVENWISGNDGYSQLDVIGLDPDPAGAIGIGNIDFSGTAAEDGEIEITIVDNRFSVTVSVSSGDTYIDVRNNALSELNSVPNKPFTMTTSERTSIASILLNSVDKGEVSSSYGVMISGSVQGITYDVTRFTGGLFNPVTNNVFDAIQGLRYTAVQWPEAWASDLDNIALSEFDSRFNASNEIMDGVIFHGKTDTYANNLAFVGSRNSQSLVVAGNAFVSKFDQDRTSIMTPADWALSYFMGVRAKRLTIGAPIGDNVTSLGLLDSIGGPALASLPYFNTPLPVVPLTSPINLFSELEQASLNDSGFTVFGVNDSEDGMVMGPVVTTWTTDAAGNENDSFHYLNAVDTGSICREIFFNTLKATYSQSRLVDGDLIPGRSMANAESIKALLLRIYKDLSRFALTIAGADAEGYFARNTTVAIDLIGRSVTISSKLPIVTQLGAFDYPLQLAFTTNE